MGEFAGSPEPSIARESELINACRDLVAFLDKNPPMGESIWAIQRIRTALRATAAGPEDMAIYREIAVKAVPACPPVGEMTPAQAVPSLADLIERLRSFEQDHEPHGWPAIQMREVSALLDALSVNSTQVTNYSDQATIAGLESSIGHLSSLVDQQLVLLSDVNDICGVDGHGGVLEDGESEIIDRVRAHVAAMSPVAATNSGEPSHA